MATIDDNFVNSLTGKLVQVNAKCSFTVNAGANQYIWFARPATNNPTFSVNGFIERFELASTFNFYQFK